MERSDRGGSNDSFLLTTRQFDQEVSRERIRSTRRSLPFCVLTITLDRADRQSQRAMARLLQRNLRMTDHKAILSRGKYAALLVDTPEMGGRTVMARLSRLVDDQGLAASMNLTVHDPEAFFQDDDSGGNSGGNSGDGPTPEQVSPPVAPPTQRASDWVRVDSPIVFSGGRPPKQRKSMRLIIKRGVDIVGAGVGLAVASPLIGAAAIAIKFQDGGSPFYCQIREGLHGRPFTIWKLRTMVVNAEKAQSSLSDRNHRDGPAFKIKDDPRVTGVGRFLRKTCIDELPQFWNVLRGDMSLVGPRPLPWHESRKCNPWQRRRLDVRPGITCYWQVDKSSVTSFDDWMRLDLKYLDGFNLMEDLRLIARTVIVPMAGRGNE